jgi:hypothetical protein
MSGTFHIRMVAGILCAFVGLPLVRDVTIFLRVGKLGELGELEVLTTFLGPVLYIALVIRFCRGSNTAALFISGLLSVGIAALVFLFVSLFVHGDLGSDPIMTGLMGLALVVSGYCWWALVLSREVRAELARRRGKNSTRHPALPA